MEQIAIASDKTYEEKKRTVRTSTASIDPSDWLQEYYTNEDGQMVCQMCQAEMPFKKRNGEYYFEAVEALVREHLPKEHHSQFLALCPLCAAMYKEFVKNDEVAMQRFKHDLLKTHDSRVHVQLGEHRAYVRFVDTHFQDLKLLVKESFVSE